MLLRVTFANRSKNDKSYRYELRLKKTGQQRPAAAGPLTNYGSVAEVAEVTEREEKTVPKTLLLRTKENEEKAVVGRRKRIERVDFGLT